MATCKNCGKTLILRRGKCFYCEQNPYDTLGSKQNLHSEYSGQCQVYGTTKEGCGHPVCFQDFIATNKTFKGYKIVVLNLLTSDGWDAPIGKAIMANSMQSLIKKGFHVKVYAVNDVNNIKKIRQDLSDDRSQLWVISDKKCHLSKNMYDLIYEHFNKGRGLYIWSDNDPFFADSNVILDKLFNTKMVGNYDGQKVLSVQLWECGSGIVKSHPIAIGVKDFYEGATISRVDVMKELKPLTYSSEGYVLMAYYDLQEKKALIDGGFTRLYYNWDSTDTDKLVVNCAIWLTNLEKFGYIKKD